jgi:acyl carrier protein
MRLIDMEYNKKEVYRIIAEILKVDIELIENMDEDEDFVIHGMNSISAIRIIVKLEETYDFELKDEDLLIDKFNTTNKMFKMLDSY